MQFFCDSFILCSKNQVLAYRKPFCHFLNFLIFIHKTFCSFWFFVVLRFCLIFQGKRIINNLSKVCAKERFLGQKHADCCDRVSAQFYSYFATISVWRIIARFWTIKPCLGASFMLNTFIMRLPCSHLYLFIANIKKKYYNFAL